ncbi:MAG: hypothetical protein V4489_09750 [Chlamydiota bacterium]
MKSLDKSIKRQKWKVLVEEWQLSGTSVRKWCREHKISNSAFHYWKARFLPVAKSRQSSFVELHEEKRSRIEMEFGGIKVYVEDDFDENLLVRCLRALKRTPSC